MEAPKAKRVPYEHILHNDVRKDNYHWLKDRENPDVIAYLEAENAYCEIVMKELEPLTERIYKDMIDKIPDIEEHVPVQSGEFFYYSRMEKDLQYPIFCRKRAKRRDNLGASVEEVILDVNALAQEGGYLSVTVRRMSNDHTKLAYLENRDGSDRYTAYIKDMSTGRLLADQIPGVFIDESLEWDALGQHLFYITVDDTQRPDKLWRHTIGAATPDELVYVEKDITFTLTISKSRSGQYLLAKSESNTTTEIRYLRADQPQEKFRMLDERRSGVEYSLEHWGDQFLILTNDGAKNFRLLQCPVDDVTVPARRELFAYDEARYLEQVYPFANALLLEGREEGLANVWIFRDGQLDKLTWEESIYVASVAENLSYSTHEALVEFESSITPESTYAINLLDSTRVCLHTAAVQGDYHPENYRQSRWWATADDGTKIPLNAMYRADALDRGPAPLILYGYGSYGVNIDPHFDPLQVALLDLGVVWVTAQVRGGSEMGRSWYEDGKLLKKCNTFTDFITAARYLINQGYTDQAHLAAHGRSAGGLLMGAVANMAPDLFAAIIPGVPFVDVVSTMLDTSIPLTSLEWDEWGNPTDPEFYWYMKSYSPYDHVTNKSYPHMFVTTGLNDPRVAYWEPAKWVARLREAKTDDHVLLLKTNMGAGHFGASGRFNHIRELAGTYAFILDKIASNL